MLMTQCTHFWAEEYSPPVLFQHPDGTFAFLGKTSELLAVQGSIFSDQEALLDSSVIHITPHSQSSYFQEVLPDSAIAKR